MKCYIITPNFSGCLEITWSADARVFSRLPSPWPRKALGTRLGLPLTLCRRGRDSGPLDHTLGDISFLSILLRSDPVVKSISDPSNEVVNLLNQEIKLARWLQLKEKVPTFAPRGSKCRCMLERLKSKRYSEIFQHAVPVNDRDWLNSEAMKTALEMMSELILPWSIIVSIPGLKPFSVH